MVYYKTVYQTWLYIWVTRWYIIRLLPDLTVYMSNKVVYYKTVYQTWLYIWVTRWYIIRRLPDLTVYMSNKVVYYKTVYQTWLYIWVTRWYIIWITRWYIIRSSNCFSFASIWVHPWFFGGVHVAHLFMFLNILSSVLWCPLQFQHKKDVRFVFTSSCL